METDCRKLSPDQQEELRRRAVSMVQKGVPPAEVADLLGTAARSVFHWMARYRSGGWHGLKTGSRSGRPSKLDESDMRFIYDTVTDGDPRQQGFPSRFGPSRWSGNSYGASLGYGSAAGRCRVCSSKWV